MSIFDKKPKSVSQNEVFVTLIQIATEKPDVRSQLLGILRLDKSDREALLEELVGDMKAKGAPREFVKALSMLLDDEVARRTLEVLETLSS
jgi:hypothetical protein